MQVIHYSFINFLNFSLWFGFFSGREPELEIVPGLTPRVQPEATGLDTNVKLGLDLEYERDGMFIFIRLGNNVA